MWTLVGEGEPEYHKHGISWKSPVGRALWGKEVGELVTINHRPAGKLEVEIIDITFEVIPAGKLGILNF